MAIDVDQESQAFEVENILDPRPEPDPKKAFRNASWKDFKDYVHAYLHWRRCDAAWSVTLDGRGTVAVNVCLRSATELRAIRRDFLTKLEPHRPAFLRVEVRQFK